MADIVPHQASIHIGTTILLNIFESLICICCLLFTAFETFKSITESKIGQDDEPLEKNEANETNISHNLDQEHFCKLWCSISFMSFISIYIPSYGIYFRVFPFLLIFIPKEKRYRVVDIFFHYCVTVIFLFVEKNVSPVVVKCLSHLQNVISTSLRHTRRAVQNITLEGLDDIELLAVEANLRKIITTVQFERRRRTVLEFTACRDAFSNKQNQKKITNNNEVLRHSEYKYVDESYSSGNTSESSGGDGWRVETSATTGRSTSGGNGASSSTCAITGEQGDLKLKAKTYMRKLLGSSLTTQKKKRKKSAINTRHSFGAPSENRNNVDIDPPCDSD